MNASPYDAGLLLRHLPAIYRESPALARLLAALESALLYDAQSGRPAALGERIANIPFLFRPLADGDAGVDAASDHRDDSDQALAQDRAAASTPAEFLPWLATWVGLNRTLIALLADGRPADSRSGSASSDAESTFRQVIANIVPLYASRGTQGYLARVLKLMLPEIEEVLIDDTEERGFEVARSRIGVNSWLVEYRPFHFRIVIRVGALTGTADARKRHERALRRGADAIIELSRPAHVSYDATWEFAHDTDRS